MISPYLLSRYHDSLPAISTLTQLCPPQESGPQQHRMISVIMMVPRSFQYHSPPRSLSPSPPKRTSPKKRQQKVDPDKENIVPSKAPRSQSMRVDESGSKPQRMLSITAATTSKPVIIPTRTNTSKVQRPSPPLSRSSSEEKAEKHDPNSIPPSMAALLAITNLSHPRGQKMRRKGFGRRTEIENFSADEYRHSLSSSSPKSWSILQSPPDTESDIEGDSIDAETDQSSITSRSVAPLSILRSLSYDSMQSLDMDMDNDSSYSMSPPSLSTRYKIRSRKDKRLSPAVPLASDGDHPLSKAMYPETEEVTPCLTPITESNDPDPFFLAMNDTPASSFKSNLTASLRLLKSAARSLSASSQLHNPATLSPGVKTLNVQETPTSSPPEESPKLSSSSLRLPSNIDALPFYLSNQLPAPRIKSSIQLQSYLTSPLSTSTATAPPIFVPAANPPEPFIEDPGPRERQQRENSNFLRVVVLEMNMRRAGKLNGDGRARLWLGARKEQFDDNKDLMSENGHGIADGVKGPPGAVFLDGEVGEAHEIENEERLEKMSRKALQRRDSIPSRWIAATP